MGEQVDNQAAAPALQRERTTGTERIITAYQECGWKDGVRANSAGEINLVQRKNKRTILTPTGLLMEGDSAQNPLNERYRDFPPITSFKAQRPRRVGLWCGQRDLMAR